MSAAVLVVGFGNALCGDDGVGPAVIERLRAAGLPRGVRAEHGGSDSTSLAELWGGEPEVWLVDALARGAAPGTIHRLEHEELMALEQRHASAHGLSLPENLRWIALARPDLARVRYRLWGVEPRGLDPGSALSSEALDAVEVVAHEIARALERTPLPRRPSGRTIPPRQLPASSARAISARSEVVSQARSRSAGSSTRSSRIRRSRSSIVCRARTR